jgi:hypothetical protein
MDSITIMDTVATAGDDAIIYTATSYRIWEYPLYRDDDLIPDSYLAVVFPIEGSTNVPYIEPGNTCRYWYLPTHQVDNVWSYPAAGNEDQFIGYDIDGQLLERNFTAGGIYSGWEYAMSHFSAEQRSSEIAHSFAAGFEVQIGGDKIEISAQPAGVGIAREFATPAMRAAVHGSYLSKDLSTKVLSVSEDVTVESWYGVVAGSDEFSVNSFLFKAAGGYTVLDHTTEPGAAAFWNLYDRPDPTFLRPWADGHCDEPTQSLRDYSPDVIIRPFFVDPGETVTVTARVRNYSDETAYNVRVRFYQGDPDDGGRPIGQDQIIATLSRANGPQTVGTSWVVSGVGEQRIYAVIDPDNELEEMHDEDTDVNNNKGYNLIRIGDLSFEALRRGPPLCPPSPRFCKPRPA